MNRSALYLRASGNIADRVPRCVVARSVALALSVLMLNRSESPSAVILECRCVDVKVG